MPVDLTFLRPGLDTENFKSPLTESECKIYLIVTLSFALTFCVLSATIVMVACYKRYRETKVHDRRKRREAEELDQMSKADVKSVSSFHQQKEMNGLEDQPGYPQVLIPNDPSRGGFSYTAQQNHYQQNQKPVTVHSVKRRDKAKTEEKNIKYGIGQRQGAFICAFIINYRGLLNAECCNRISS